MYSSIETRGGLCPTHTSLKYRLRVDDICRSSGRPPPRFLCRNRFRSLDSHNNRVRVCHCCVCAPVAGSDSRTDHYTIRRTNRHETVVDAIARALLRRMLRRSDDTTLARRVAGTANATGKSFPGAVTAASRTITTWTTTTA